MGCTSKGGVLCKGSFQVPSRSPLLRTPSQNPLFHCATHGEPLSRNPSENPSPESYDRLGVRPNSQKRSGDPNPQYFSKSTAVEMGDVLPYKWEAYCSTNGRRTAGFPFLRSLEARKVLRYKWGAYCRTNWRCTAVLFRQVVGVGVSETLPKIQRGAH